MAGSLGGGGVREGQHCSCQSDPTKLTEEEGQATGQSSASGRGDLEDVQGLQELRR